MIYFNTINPLKRWINQQVCCNDYRIFKLLLINLKREDNCINIVKDRLKTFLRVLKMPLYLRIGKQITKNIVCSSSNKEQKIEDYIKNYDNVDNLFFISTFITDRIYIDSIGSFFRFIKYYIIIVKDTFLLTLIFNKLSTRQFSIFLYLKIKIYIYRPEKIYIVSPRNPEFNLIALCFSNCDNINIDLINGVLMNTYQRYGFYNRVRLCFISKVSLAEYEALTKIGWIKSQNVQTLVTGNIEQIKKQDQHSSFLFDVGFYSSGIWARNGVNRTYDLDNIKQNKKEYHKNIYAKIEMIVLYNLIKFAKKYNFKLIIYLHPYEKDVINQFGIYPPYWNKGNGSTIIIDNNLIEKNNFFETEIGIVINSTIFYDRWDNDLITLCYYPKRNNKLVLIPLKYLGKYSKYGFKNLKELEQKIVNVLHKKDESQ